MGNICGCGKKAQMTETGPRPMEQCTFGGGCFWCVEAAYKRNKGVIDAVSGYAGGDLENPTYKEVKGKDTGHAEVVQVTFDPSVISFEEILTIFWKVHNPTQLNRQGNDKGPQYRSTIMYQNEAQKKIIEDSIVKEQMNYFDKIVTVVEPLKKFWPAENVHQNYFDNNPQSRYVQKVVAPKVEKMKDLPTYQDK